MRAVLFARRAPRPRPGWDDKVLADWNGLMIAALANAAGVFGEPAWLDAAREAFDYIAGPMAAGERLRHSARHGRSKEVEFLDDYAEMARAALMLAEASGDDAYVTRARGWVAILDAHYWDAAEGGYFYAPDDAEASISRTKTAHDSATPAGNGTMVGVLARLHYLTGEGAYLERAEAAGEGLLRRAGAEFFRHSPPSPTTASCCAARCRSWCTARVMTQGRRLSSTPCSRPACPTGCSPNSRRGRRCRWATPLSARGSARGSRRLTCAWGLSARSR